MTRDPRLQWRQLATAQPNVSGLLRNAQESLDQGFEAANDILGRYQTGLEAKNDLEVRQEIAALGGEEAYQQWLANGGVGNRQISKELREQIGSAGGVRDMLLGQADQRQITTNRADSNSRANAGEARTAADYNDRVARRDAARGAASIINDAQQFARNNGETVGPIRETGGNLQAAYEGLIARGMPAHIAEGFVMNFQDESGGVLDINERNPLVPGSRGGRGLYQLTGDRRRQFEAKYGEDGYTLDNQLDFLMEELNTTEAGAWSAIQQAGTAGEAGAAIVNRFLRPSEEYRAARANRYINGQGQVVTERASPPQQARTQLEQTGLFTAAEIDDMLKGVSAAADERTAEVEAAEADLLNELSTSGIADIFANPEITTPEQARSAIFSDERFTAAENEQRWAQMQTMIGNDPTRLQPEVEQDVRFQNIIEGTNQDIEAAISATPQGRINSDTARFEQAEDVAVELEEMLNLDRDGQSAGWWGGVFSKGQGGYDRNNLRNMIDDVADENQISQAQAAAVMREVFERDPLSFLGFNANTLENRFEAEDIREMARQVLNPESQSAFGDSQRKQREFNQRLNTLNDEVIRLQQETAKGGDRQANAARISEIYAEMSQIRQQAQQLYRN